MAEEDDQKGGQSVGEDTPAMCEEVVEKLKLLNYERDFLSNKGHRPLNRAYFAVQTNPNEQFGYFKTLVKWLFQVNEAGSSEITKYDDPMTICTTIQMEAKKLGLDVDFPPIKLKSGSGEQVCYLLLQLVNRALKAKKFAFKAPRFDKVSRVDEEPEQDEEGDQNLDLAENIEAPEDGIDDDDGQNLGAENIIPEDRAIVESNIDAKEWLIEVERVSSKLKVSVQNEPREWRSHIEQARQYDDSIKKLLPEARSRLEKHSEQLGKVLEKIAKREKNINYNMNDLGTEYKAKAEELKTVATKYNELNKTVKDMSEQYKQVTERYEQIMAKTSEHGNSVTDSSPVQKIKLAIQNLKNEITSMDLRIGVLSHTVMQHKFKERKHRDDKELEHEIGDLIE